MRMCFKRNVLFGVLLATLLIWTVWGNTALEWNAITINSDKLPESFDGFCIAHVSDLHNAEMGTENEKLLAMLGRMEPDMIAITGDLIDSRNTDMEIALDFVRKAMQIAPCYYVTGNHEARVSEYGTLKEELEAAGVLVLDNRQAELERSGESISILGIDDPSFSTDYLFGDDRNVVGSRLSGMLRDEDGYKVLLSHRPELFDVYAEYGLDLVLSGHAHGGQFRLPFAGGLVAPNQGIFPKFDSGLFTEGSTNMVVSRGIGNSLLPFRFNNRPEVILIVLNRI